MERGAGLRCSQAWRIIRRRGDCAYALKLHWKVGKSPRSERTDEACNAGASQLQGGTLRVSRPGRLRTKNPKPGTGHRVRDVGAHTSGIRSRSPCRISGTLVTGCEQFRSSISFPAPDVVSPCTHHLSFLFFLFIPPPSSVTVRGIHRGLRSFPLRRGGRGVWRERGLFGAFRSLRRARGVCALG